MKLVFLCLKWETQMLQCVYWNQGHPHNENQSEGRTETILIQHFQIQPIKCPVQNNGISTCSLTGDVYATTVSVKCQAQTGSTFMCLSTVAWKGHRLFFLIRDFFFFHLRLFFLSATFFFIRDFPFFIRDFFFHPRLFFYPRLLFLPGVLRLQAHVHRSRPEISRAGNMAAANDGWR